MYSVFRFNKPEKLRKFRILFLALMILSGLLSGIYVADCCGPVFFSLMNIDLCDVSIVGLLAVISFPLLTALMSIFPSMRCFLFPLSFLRYFLFGFSVWEIMMSLGKGGWLFSIMYSFTSCMMLPMEEWLISHYINTQEVFRFKDLTVLLSMMGFIIFLDLRFISPILIAMA